MRASLPSPSTSCACTIATRAREENVSAMRSHHGSSATPGRAASTRARRSAGSDSYQPRSVSLSCVPV